MLQIAAIFSAVVFFLTIAGLAYYSSQPPTYPSAQQSATQPHNEQPTKDRHTFRGFINFLFPDAISIFTFWLVIATIGLGIIAGLQISFLGRAELISAEAAKAAKESAEAAKKSIETATEATHLDQRAWIGLEFMDAIPNFPEVGKTFAAKGTLVNSGKTPALNLLVYSIIEPVLRESCPNFAYTGIEKFNSGTLPPRGKGFIGPLLIPKAGTTDPAIITQEQLDLLKQGRFNFFIHGRVEYDDIFGNHHWMTFCSFLQPVGGFAFCHEHNETDNNQKTK